MRNNKNNISFNIKNITLCLLILILSSINIINTFTYIPNASALSYQSSTNIGFTFNPTISVSISPNNLIIPNLTPGTAADSNPITVSVSTNTAYGYHLTVNVGSNTDNYNTTNLVHTTSAISAPTTNATFASLAYGANITDKNNLPTNTWGYIAILMILVLLGVRIVVYHSIQTLIILKSSLIPIVQPTILH